MAELKYRRVLLKLSGEALAGEKQIGIDPHTVSKICAEIADVVEMGLEVALVIGGGNIFRGLSASAEGMVKFSSKMRLPFFRLRVWTVMLSAP